MNIVTCQFCRKPFAAISGKICPNCMEQIDRDFIKVRDYIYENEKSNLRPNIDTIAEETEVSKQIIIHLVKEGRLIIDSPDGEGGGLIVCESCKKPIKTGRLCENCMKAISNSIDRAAAPAPTPAAKKPEPNFKGSAKIR